MQTSNPPEQTNADRTGRRPANSYTPAQLLFLLRFQRLLDKWQQYLSRLKADDWRMKALNKALYSTYRDCVALGVGEEARGMRRQVMSAE